MIYRINLILRQIDGGPGRQAGIIFQEIKEADSPFGWGETSVQNKSVPTPQQRELLRVITEQFRDFKSDANEEMGALEELRMQDPGISTEVDRVKTSLNNFFTTTDQFFNRDGGYSGRTMRDSLRSLLGELTGTPASVSINQTTLGDNLPLAASPSDTIISDEDLQSMSIPQFLKLYQKVGRYYRRLLKKNRIEWNSARGVD